MKLIAMQVTDASSKARAVNQLLRLQTSLERSLAAELNRKLSAQLHAMANDIGDRSSVAAAQQLVDHLSSREVEQVLKAYYYKTFKLIGEAALATLKPAKQKDKPTFDIIRDRFIASQAAKRAKGITETTKKVLREVFADALKEGLGTSQIAKVIREEIDGIGFLNAAQRSFVIARTEIHTASTTAMDTAAKASGFELVREWATVMDGRQRAAHEDVNGQQRSGDEAFDVDGEALMYPGDPDGSAGNIIQCRCQVLYTRNQS